MMSKKNYFILGFIIFFIVLVPYKEAKAVNKNNKYLILDEMYVINDLNDIVRKINYLYERGIPFIISTMPIFNNTDIEAAQRYYEVLRYAEAKNGSIILHFPDISEDNILNISIDELINKMNITYDSFINYEVYPKAIDIPEKFLKHKKINDYLNLSDTLFMDIDIDIDIDNIEFKLINNFIEKIPYNKYDEKKESRSSLGLVIPSNIKFNEFKAALDSINEIEVYFNDFSYLNTFIKIGENEIKSREGNLYLNNKNVMVQRFISRDEFEYMLNEEKVKEDTIDLSNLNKVLIILTSIATIIFIIIAINNRRIDRNKFFK